MSPVAELLAHPAVQALRQATLGTAFENQLFLVGGAVRDALLGRAQDNDLDFVTELDALELAALLYDKEVSSIAPVVYPRFGTAMLRIESCAIELVRARKESYRDDSRKPEVGPATLQEDALRRDFTVNALMLNIHTGEMLDLTGNGLQDLESKTLQTPLDPDQRFIDDPLRMLRAIRFRWQLGFTPAEDLYPAILRNVSRLKVISFERIRDELTKILTNPDADKALEDLRLTGLLHQFAPEFEAMVGMDQGDYHHLNVWDHTRLVVKNAGPDDLITALAALLHDVGKPQTRFVDEQGKIRFYNHEVVGAEIARKWLTKMKFSGDEIDSVTKLVRNHMRLGSFAKFSASAARRVHRDLGTDVERLLNLVEADANGLKAGVRVLDLSPIRAQLDRVKVETPSLEFNSPLTGGEIAEILNLEPGPQIGAAKKWLIDKVLDGDLEPSDTKTARKLLLERYQKDESATKSDTDQ